MNEFNNVKQLKELIICVPSKKTSDYNINEYLCVIEELCDINLQQHFFTKIKLLLWLMDFTYCRDGSISTRMYLYVELPQFIDPKVEELLNNIKIPSEIKKIILYNDLINILHILYINIMSGIVDNLYDDALSLGKIQSLIGLILASIIGLVLIIVGYNYVSSSNKYILTTGIVKNVICEDKIQTNSKNKSTTTTKICTLNIEYNVNNVVYTNILTVNNKVYSTNQSIQIEYMESNPNQIRIPGVSDSTLGYISSGISVLIILGASVNYYLSTNYKL